MRTIRELKSVMEFAAVTRMKEEFELRTGKSLVADIRTVTQLKFAAIEAIVEGNEAMAFILSVKKARDTTDGSMAEMLASEHFTSMLGKLQGKFHAMSVLAGLDQQQIKKLLSQIKKTADELVAAVKDAKEKVQAMASEGDVAEGAKASKMMELRRLYTRIDVMMDELIHSMGEAISQVSELLGQPGLDINQMSSLRKLQMLLQAVTSVLNVMKKSKASSSPTDFAKRLLAIRIDGMPSFDNPFKSLPLPTNLSSIFGSSDNSTGGISARISEFAEKLVVALKGEHGEASSKSIIDLVQGTVSHYIEMLRSMQRDASARDYPPEVIELRAASVAFLDALKKVAMLLVGQAQEQLQQRLGGGGGGGAASMMSS